MTLNKEPILKLSYEGVSAVPNVQCISCGQTVVLDAITYGNYQGPVTCPSGPNRSYLDNGRNDCSTGGLIFSFIQESDAKRLTFWSRWRRGSPELAITN